MSIAAFEAMLPRTVQLKPFTLYDVTHISANAIELVRDDGRALLRLCGADSVEVRFRLRLLATDPERVEIQYPMTWRDAFKARWFPKWLLKRYPANYTTHSITKAGLYPEIPCQGSRLVAIPYMEVYQGGYSDNGGADDE